MAQSFSIAPATSSGPVWVLAFVLFVMLGVIAAVGRSVVASRTARFEVSTTNLTLKGDWYGREIPREAIRVEDVRVANLRQERDLQPVSRRFGTGLPGYGSGWFRLRNGERALVYLTNQERVVVIPTTLGYTVMLSPRDADGLARALRGAN